MGELGLFYRFAPVVLIGGSLVPHGGQNPLESARLDCAILHGPHMFNFIEVAAELAAAGATQEVVTPQDIAASVTRHLSDEPFRGEHARAAGPVP